MIWPQRILPSKRFVLLAKGTLNEKNTNSSKPSSKVFIGRSVPQHARASSLLPGHPGAEYKIATTVHSYPLTLSSLVLWYKCWQTERLRNGCSHDGAVCITMEIGEEQEKELMEI